MVIIGGFSEPFVKLVNIRNKPYIDFINEFDRIYEGKKPQYGESWKTVPVIDLINKLTEEYLEWEKSYLQDINVQMKELADIANVCWMLWTRLNEVLVVKNKVNEAIITTKGVRD